MSNHKTKVSTYKGIRFCNKMIEAVDKQSPSFSAYVKAAVQEKLERESKR